jgi:hypothetical protein
MADQTSQAVHQRLDRVEGLLHKVLGALGIGHGAPGGHGEPMCGVSIGGAAHTPHPIHDEQAALIQKMNPKR